MDDLSHQAIAAALSCDWEKAIVLNNLILDSEPENIDALNRLARGYAEMGQLPKARECAEKVLQIDPLNNIALKSLAKWNLLKATKPNGTRILSPKAFLEEAGKTKTVTLINVSDPQTLLSLTCGDCLLMQIHQHNISVVSSENQYIGKLPDDLSHRLKKLIEHGNEYLCLVKNTTAKEAKIFIKETKRGEDVKHISSFSAEKIQYVAFTAPELVHKRKNVTSG